jgi:uncharacterized protein (DUF952 family)
MGKKIYKILRQEEWSTALESGVLIGSPIDIQDGFIHFSCRDQVEETARKHFKSETNLFLLEVDENDLSDTCLKWEKSRGNQLFPHLYDTLHIDLISQVWPLVSRENGQHDFSFLTRPINP